MLPICNSLGFNLDVSSVESVLYHCDLKVIIALNCQFNREPGKLVEEFKLRVTYVMASPPSPVSEEQQEGSSPRSSTFEDGAQSLQTQDSVSGC